MAPARHQERSAGAGGGHQQAVCEAWRWAKLGLDPEGLLPTLMAGAASNWFLDKRGATLRGGEVSPQGFKVRQHAQGPTRRPASMRDSGTCARP
jgi:3-hydroxyisobutyrate dehydrogenase